MAESSPSAVAVISIPCPHCGYDLRGCKEAHRCPECGTDDRERDVTERASIMLEIRTRGFQELAEWFSVGLVITCITIPVSFTFPSVAASFACLSLMFFAMAAFGCLLHTAKTFREYRIYQFRRSRLKWRMFRWLVFDWLMTTGFVGMFFLFSMPTLV